jgi:hypothetical protein
MIDCFDLLHEEGAETPKIMSVALDDCAVARLPPTSQLTLLYQAIRDIEAALCRR